MGLYGNLAKIALPHMIAQMPGCFKFTKRQEGGALFAVGVLVETIHVYFACEVLQYSCEYMVVFIVKGN